jgi:hypothetical protein
VGSMTGGEFLCIYFFNDRNLLLLPRFQPQSVQSVVCTGYHNYVYVLLFPPFDETKVYFM